MKKHAVILFMGMTGMITPELHAVSPDLANSRMQEQALTSVESLDIDEPVTVIRKNGSSFSGKYERLMTSGVTISRKVGTEGIVEVDFVWADIDKVLFSGETLLGGIEAAYEAEDYAAVVDVMTPLYEQRSVFFPAMSLEQIQIFEMLANSYLNLNMPTEALGVVRNLKKWVNNRVDIDSLSKIELLTYLQLGLDDEVIDIARQMIESSNDPGQSSLAWVALSIHLLDQGDYREAWLTSVHPILFDHRKDSPDLPDAYLVAMAATLKLNQPRVAYRYHQSWKALQMEQLDKPYLSKWYKWVNSIDWDKLQETASEIEAFADIETQFQADTSIHESKIPVMQIPTHSLRPK